MALAQLPPDHQRAVYLRYIEGLPQGEIAGLMHRSTAAVNGLLFRGLRELRQLLGDAVRFFSDAPDE